MATKKAVTVLAVTAILTQVGWAVQTEDAVKAVANRLQKGQVKKEGVFPKGSWPNELLFTGSIASGMIGAYEMLEKEGYLTAAEDAASLIISKFSMYNDPSWLFYGDQAYAMARLSRIPRDFGWIRPVQDMYELIRQAGTGAYVDCFLIEPDISTGVFYLAHHVLAAYAADAVDREIWRTGLIRALSCVDDETAAFPVMALGVATWALVKTGPLDDTLIDPQGEGCPYWKGKHLKDLPQLALNHQVPAGEPFEGSFFWRFDHLGEVSGGYTEDTIFVTLALAAVLTNDPNEANDPNVPAGTAGAVVAASQALLSGIDQNGQVGEHLFFGDEKRFVYAGEMLEVLTAKGIRTEQEGIN